MTTYWITGAAGAIGSALCEQLAAAGHNLVLSGRDDARLQALAGRLPTRTLALAGDLTQAATATRLLQVAEAELGPVQGLAHCVGSTLIRPLHLTRDEDLGALMQVNFFSAAYTLRAFVQSLRKQRLPGSAVLVGSLVAHAGFPNHEGIGSAKAAVAGLALSTAASYADKGIRVNCVHPGLTISPLTARLTDSPEAIARNARQNPMQRLGAGHDTAAMMAFLLSDAAGWITGQQINVDGGQALLHPLPRD